MSTVHQLSPAAEAALATAREAGRAQGIEEGRAQWAEYVNGAANAAAQAALAPLKDQFDAAVTELRSFHATHTKTVRQGSFWRGFAIGGVAIAFVAGLSIWGAWRDAQLVTAAGRAIEQRGGTEIPSLTIRDPNDTNDDDLGYERPGREPASARR